jgi:predicted permease
MALVALVLLIACANLANLLTARAAARGREVAVRLAMGAARARVIRQFLTESLLLSIASAAAGLFIAAWSTRVLVAMLAAANSPEAEGVVVNLNPDWRMVLFTAAIATCAGMLFGLGPAFRATSGNVTAALKEQSQQVRGSGLGFGRILLGVQVALSIVLLAAAGLFARSLFRILIESPGFDPANVTLIAIDISKRPEKGSALTALLSNVLERAQALPGAESASLTTTTPLGGFGWDNFVEIPGRTDLSEEQRDADVNGVGPQFFQTMRIPILSGRDFTNSDGAQSEKVALISRNAAERWFPHGDAVGSHFALPNLSERQLIRIVGIAGDIKDHSLRAAPLLALYLPYTQTFPPDILVIRTRMPVNRTAAAFREVLRQAAPGTPIRTVKTMEQQVDESLSTERLTAYLSLFIAALALLLTAVGLYGILAYSVARRTGEIGIRMALGAQRRNVVWLVIREAMGHTFTGAIVGVAVVLAASKVIASLLYEVRPNDPATLACAVAALALVCAIAAWLPARRASRLDPMAALREE